MLPNQMEIFEKHMETLEYKLSEDKKSGNLNLP